MAEKAGRIIRLICVTTMSLWVTCKLVLFTPLLAIPLIGATILFMINEIAEIKHIGKKKKTNKKKKVKAKAKTEDKK